MGLLLTATAISVLGFAWAKQFGATNLERLNQFGNAAGVLTRVLTVFDALRQVANWFADGKHGSGPLTVPVPARQTQPAPRPASRFADEFSGDTILTPKPSAVFP